MLTASLNRKAMFRNRSPTTQLVALIGMHQNHVDSVAFCSC